MQSKLNTGAILSDGLTEEEMTDLDDPVSPCLFRIVDLIHISFKDIVMCSILKVLTLHFFYVALWLLNNTATVLYTVCSSMKAQIILSLFYSSRGLCESELLSHFLPHSCVFVLHIFPA